MAGAVPVRKVSKMANNKDLEKAAKRDRNIPGMGPKNASKPSISAPKNKVSIDPKWTQKAFEKKTITRKDNPNKVSVYACGGKVKKGKK